MKRGVKMVKWIIFVLFILSNKITLSDYLFSPNFLFRRIKSIPVANHPLIAWFNQIGKNDTDWAGGKGANLGELSQIAGVPVPPGFVVTTSSYRKFLEANPGLREAIIQIFKKEKVSLDEIKSWQNITTEENLRINRVSQQVKELILKAKVPEEIKNEIIIAYKKLEAERVAVRSSATAEDTSIKAFAGAHDTYLNVHGENAVVEAVQHDWASLFNSSAITARGQAIEKAKKEGKKTKISLDDPDIAVVVQKMVENGELQYVDTDRSLSGTGFTLDPDTGWRPGITTEAVALMEWGYGLGESMVGGKQRGDRFMLAKNPEGKWMVIGKEKGYPKGKMVIFSSRTETDPRKATQWLEVPERLAEKFAVSEGLAIKMAEIFEKIHKHYGQGMDIEFAVDKDGKPWITQARLETNYNPIPIEKVVFKGWEVPEDIAESAKKLLQGDQGTGAALGKVVKIPKGLEGEALLKELEKLGSGDILVTEATTPDMEPAMARAGAIIAVTGGVTSHAAIVGRELGKPVIVGVGEKAWELKDGQKIIVDANRGYVYEYDEEKFKGSNPLVEVSEEYLISDFPLTRTKVGLIIANPAQARKVSALSLRDSHGGVNLLRAEFALARMQMHPMAFLEYDNGKLQERLSKATGSEKQKIQNLIETIKIKIKGYSSATEYYIDQLSRAIAQVAALQKPNQYMIYRTTDFKSNEYKQLEGGWLYESDEPNPMLGYRGEGRMIHPSYQPLFEMEIKAVKRAREVFGYKNIEVMLPVVRTPEELQRALDFMAKNGLKRGVDGLRVGIMVEVPSNVFFLDEFLKKGVDFISIGSNDLAQFGLAVGRDSENPKVKEIFTMSIKQPQDTAIVTFLETIIRGARFFGVKSGICGAAPSINPEYARYLVEFGIDSIGVEPKVYKKVSETVADAEKKVVSATGHWPFFERGGSPKTISANKVSADAVLKELDLHPELILRNESMKKEAVEKIYQKIKEAYQKSGGKMVIYETTEMSSLDYMRLMDGHGIVYEAKDANPKLGFLGMTRVLANGFFDLELEAIKKARSEGINVGIKFNMVRVPKEVETALERIKNMGLNGIQVGIGIDNPAVLADLYKGKFKNKINFVELNAGDKEQLALYMFSADPESPMAPLIPPGEIDKYIQILESIAKAAAEAYNHLWLFP